MLSSVAAGWDGIWRAGLLSAAPHVLHGSVSKRHGPLEFGLRPHPEIIERRRRLAVVMGFESRRIHLLNQVHGCHILEITEESPAGGMEPDRDRLPAADGMVTRVAGVVLVVRTADCVPVFFHAPDVPAVGIAHAGWQGTSQDIAGTMVRKFVRMGADPGTIKVALGPAVCAGHYDVSRARDGRVDLFRTLFPAPVPVVVALRGGIALDLVEANRRQCLAAGVRPGHVETCPLCTAENTRDWPSLRGEGELADHHAWNVIGLRTATDPLGPS